MTKAMKFDSDKAPLDLIPYEAQEEIAKVLGFGAKKYARGNFTKGLEYSRLIAAALRHLNQFNSGEDKDPESGLSHIAHAGCMIAFLLYMEKNKPEMDDRWAKKQPNPVLMLKEGKSYVAVNGEIKGPAVKGYQTMNGRQVYYVGKGGHDGAYVYFEDGEHVYGVKTARLVAEVG